MGDTAGSTRAPLAVSGGRIYTMNSRQPVVEALLVRDGRIDFLGSAAEAHRRAAEIPGCVSLDLGGGCAVPGFTDSHIHFLSYGLNLSRVALADVASLPTVLQRVDEAAQATAPGGWVEGWGWDHSLWAEAVFPDKAALDRAAPDVPVALWRKDGHMTWLNSPALAAAGIDRQTPDPE
ncbi:MAG: amidohydrolase family protein, partial [Chloroflexota bacterium]|nr:amidohydrolase family protein [Chloroflexota bacterium]